MGVDYRQEFLRLVNFLESQNFPYMDRVKANGPKLSDLQITIFLCIMEFLMNIVCFEQLNWKPVSVQPDGKYRLKITREERVRILNHLIAWQHDLPICPKLNTSQLTNELSSWSKRRAELLVAAMDEMDNLFNSLTLPSQTPNRRISGSLLDSFENSRDSFNDSVYSTPCGQIQF